MIWKCTTALCCSASCAAGEQTTTMAADRQSFLCRGPSTIWPLAGNSPADCLLIWRTAVMKERRGASHLAWPMMNRGQMIGYRGQSRKHITVVITVHTIYASQPEKQFPCICGFRSLKPLRKNGKKSCLKRGDQWGVFSVILHLFHLPSCMRGQSTWQQLQLVQTQCLAKGPFSKVDPSLHGIWTWIFCLEKLLIFLFSLPPVATCPHYV